MRLLAYSLCQQISKSAYEINLLGLQRMFPLLLTIYSTIGLCPDELATARAPVTNEELIVKIFSDLGPKYPEISAADRAHDTAITYKELYEKLVDHELFLKHEDMKKTPTLITAAITQKNNNNKNNYRSNNSSWQSSIPKNNGQSA
ncbi:hypothetical protein ACH5RR_041506 [Cinchona calisaya]|uniref:Uncharacterized protein n=1 Tax=Cinchona calisaya TaxID=153742 RepID=A0ABD2XX20_9GENT